VTHFTEKTLRNLKVKKVNKNNYCAFHTWNGVIEIYNPYQDRTLCSEGDFVHELAHHWDSVWDISPKFASYVGATIYLFPWYDPWYNPGEEAPPKYGAGDPPNAYEDFAESVAEYIYDQGPNREVIRRGEKRWKFVESLLTYGIILPLPNDLPNYCRTFPHLPGLKKEW
jgi:hypothetical protein